MGLQQEKRTKDNQVSTRGPSMATDPNPPNPSDEIFQGKALPVVQPQADTVRRAFSIPTRPPLHREDGVDGAAEVVTSRGSGPQGANHGAKAGEDGNKYSANPNDAYTDNGEWIRGT